MDIYDLTKDYLKLTTIEASNASVCDWSPDGRHILTATTSPRLRVDNGIRLWHVLGGLMYNEEMAELYDVTWRPSTTTKHPLENPVDPAPPPHASALSYLGRVKTPSKPAGAYRPPGARGTSTPLHFKREDEGGAAFVNNSISSTGGSVVNGFGARKRRDVPGAQPVEKEDAEGNALPPGAAPGGGVSLTTGAGEGEENMSKAAVKNRKKREARKVKEREEGAGTGAGTGAGADGEGQRERQGGEVNGTGGKSGHLTAPGQWREGKERSRSRQGARDRSANRTPREPKERDARKAKDGKAPPQQQELAMRGGAEKDGIGDRGPPREKNGTPSKPQQPTVNTLQTEEAPGGSAGADPGSPQDKKVRSLMKKLRAIEELKMRQAGGEKLELSQVSKIGSEEVVKRELDGLGGGG